MENDHEISEATKKLIEQEIVHVVSQLTAAFSTVVTELTMRVCKEIAEIEEIDDCEP